MASDKIIVFTENDGFVVLENFSLAQRRYGHISLRMDTKNYELEYNYLHHYYHNTHKLYD